MRIIRTGRGIASPVQVNARVDKGWVREGILSGLSMAPSTLTEVSRRLGVSKSTASYHLSLLLERGIIEVVDSSTGRGGVQVKRYGLREGSLVTMLSRRDEEAELGRLRETFDIQALAWESSSVKLSLEEVQNLLYKMFLHLFKIARSEHGALMRECGNRTGAILARRVPRLSTKETLVWLTSYLSAAGISDSEVLEIPNSAVSVVVSNTCVGSTFHQTNSCYFLEGIIEGVVKATLGPNIKVERVVVPGIPSCTIAIGRVKRLELGRVSDLILTSLRQTGAGRGLWRS